MFWVVTRYRSRIYNEEAVRQDEGECVDERSIEKFPFLSAVFICSLMLVKRN